MLSILLSIATAGAEISFYKAKRTLASAVIVSTAAIFPVEVWLGASRPMGLSAMDRGTGVFAYSFTALKPSLSTSNAQAVFGFIRKQGSSNSYLMGDQVLVDTLYNVGGGSGYGASCIGIDTETAVGVVFGTASSQTWLVPFRRRTKVLGIAVDATGRVQTSGIWVTTGLTAGARYYSDDNGALSTTPSECQIGYARSATELVLNVILGV